MAVGMRQIVAPEAGEGGGVVASLSPGLGLYCQHHSPRSQRARLLKGKGVLPPA